MEDCRYTILYNNVISQDSRTDCNLLTNHLRDKSEGVDLNASIVEYSSDEKMQIRDFCITQRNAIECQNRFKMVIGTAWAHQSLRSIGCSYGEVIYIDATEGTNEEERPLLTMSTCT
eukprot:15350327-Ditylum_brightwellii.AAC.1